MFTNRKERMELLQGLITSNMDAKIPTFQQVAPFDRLVNDCKSNRIAPTTKLVHRPGAKCWKLGPRLIRVATSVKYRTNISLSLLALLVYYLGGPSGRQLLEHMGLRIIMGSKAMLGRRYLDLFAKTERNSLRACLQKIMLIWGEEDRIFNIELAKKMKE